MSVVIEDGIYEILYAIDPTKAIDCKGAADRSGENIWLFNKNDTAAQYWSITNYDDGVQIICSLSGRSMDLANNSLKNGTNIRQWEDNNSHAQRWDIVADGKTVTYNGVSYPSYVIKSHGTNFAVDVSGGGAKSGTNIQIYTASDGNNAQRWIFIPIPYFNEQGTYKIVSAMDSKMCADVAGGSTANKANVQLYTDNGTPAQSWYTYLNDDQTITFINTNSMKALDNYGAVGTGGNALIHQINRTIAQCAFVKRYGHMTYAGQTVPTYLIEIQAGSGGTPAVLDAWRAKTTNGTNLFFHNVNYGLNQRWALIPEAAVDSNMLTPAFYDYGTNIGNSRTTAEFQFACNWTDFQIRARFRTKTTNSGYSDWSSWKSAYDGLGGNNGWGDEWSPNITYSKSSADKKTLDVPIPESYRVDGSTVTAMDCQVEMRTFKNFTQKDTMGYTLHCQNCGASASKTKSYYWKPTAHVTSAVLSGSGLSIGYSSDLDDGGCTVTVWYGDISETATGQYGGSGSVLIPNTKITSLPSGSVECKVQVSTSNVSSDIASKSVTVTDANNRTGISISQGETDYGTHLITISDVRPASNANDKIVLRLSYGNNTLPASVRETNTTSTVYEAVSPLKTDITALAWMIKSDGTWDVKQMTLKPISDHMFCWTFEGGGAVLDLGTSRPGATQEDSIERETETYKIVGRDYESYRFKKTKTRDLSVSGIIVNGVEGHGSYEQLVALLNAGHATFRNNRGEILSVAVTAISKPLEHSDHTEVKVTQHQETR